MAEYQSDPWGLDRADWNAGMIASVIANVNRGKNSKAYKPSDFMPQYGKKERKRQQSPEDIKNFFMGLTKQMEQRAKQ